MLAKFARLQGLEDEAKEFEKDAAKIKDCFNARFLTVKKGTSPVQTPHVLYPDSIFYGNNTVTANILPLAFDMVPEAYREEVEKNVITGIITRNKGHISSGVIGMNWMMRELTRMGRGDVAFLLASNKTYPSYGYMIEKGATAIWELWNGEYHCIGLSSNVGREGGKRQGRYLCTSGRQLYRMECSFGELSFFG